MNRNEKQLFLLLTVYLIIARVVVLFPFRYIKSYLQQSNNKPEASSAEFEKTTVKNIQIYLNILVRLLPLKLVCLPQAIACKRVLTHFGVVSELHICLLPKRNYKENAKNSTLQLHAWLTVKDEIVCGAIKGSDLRPVMTVI